MEYGGESLLDYIKNNIIKYKLSIWKSHVRALFRQMCYYINWLHSNGVCHLDLSLENCLIKNNIVYFCDFGLSEYFRNNNFKCNKYCGKLMYQCPEIYNKAKYYDARKADVWSLGIIMFLMNTGASVQLYNKPNDNDPYYCNVINEQTKKMVNSWGMIEYVDDIVFHLLHKICKKESKRYTIQQILLHPYLKYVYTYTHYIYIHPYISTLNNNDIICYI